MFMDKNLLLSDGQAITATAASTNVIDFLTSQDMGIGADPALKVLVNVGTAFTAAGAGTLTIQYQTSDDNSTFTTIAETPALALASLTAAARLFGIDVPRSRARYARLNYVVATGPMTAGTLTAAIVLDRSDHVYYPSGFTVAN